MNQPKSQPKGRSGSGRRVKVGTLALGPEPAVAGVIVGGVDCATIRRIKEYGPDLIELRVDTLRANSIERIERTIGRIKETKLPLLLTIRSAKEGGTGTFSETERLDLFRTLAGKGAPNRPNKLYKIDAIDIELSSKRIIKDVIALGKANKVTVIASYHNFKSTPTLKTLQRVVDEGRELGAEVVKVAARVRGSGDLKVLNTLLATNDNLIVIGMGESKGARLTRTLFPLLGSLVTYGSIKGASAPGQLSVKALKKEIGELI